MAVFRIKQGKDIRLKGAADREIAIMPLPPKAAVQPSDFRGLKPRLCVKAGDAVKVGTPILEDKVYSPIKVVSPVSGRVAAINRGKKRFLLEIVIESDGRQEAVAFQKFSREEIPHLTKETIEDHLLKSGLWPVIRQRPFSRLAHPDESPKSIFVHAMNTEPLAPEADFILHGREAQFQAGLDILQKLTQGKIYLCAQEGARFKALTEAQDACLPDRQVEMHYFSGPHPAGNVGTHIHYLDPVHKGDHVWYVEAQDVLRIASLFLDGVYSAERIVAVTGEGAAKRIYAKTIVGAPLSLLLAGSRLEGMCCISGSVLTGKDVGHGGYLRFYDSQVTVIPEGGERKFLGWLSPGFDKYTFSKMFASSFLPQGEASLTTDKHGSDRAIVLNDVYDRLVALDIMTYFLVKAIYGEDIEEMERLGILECDEEDFALCTFACPSKTDVGAMIRQGLDLIEHEG
jgi:Na+-transporting NADH:ubiquinone oxidoreductase subunit A